LIAVLVVLLALAILITAAYRGYSVILFAPVAAMFAVLLTHPSVIPPVFTNVFMEKMAAFLKLYFPVFLLGSLFGKLIEISDFSAAVVSSVARFADGPWVMPTIVLTSALLTYGGVSLFVVVFAVYPFAARMFKRSNIPKRLMPATIALGAFTFTMDSLPGTPQIQNIIPTSFFGTTTWAAPWLGVTGSIFILCTGLLYLEYERRKARKAGEGYGTGHKNEPVQEDTGSLPNPLIATAPLFVVTLVNLALTHYMPRFYGATVTLPFSGIAAAKIDVKSIVSIWSIEGALIAGCLCVFGLAFSKVVARFVDGTTAAVSGALLASLNTASEYGFGAVIALLPGFLVIQGLLGKISNPLIDEAVSISALAGVTGSASGGLSIALASMSQKFLEAAHSAHIPPEVLHRVAAMASGGMDTLPHNGAVITLLFVTGLTHRQSYSNIFVITLIKSAAVAVVIATYYLTGLV
jgi:H+/gluconate symporter-like permease